MADWLERGRVDGQYILQAFYLFLNCPYRCQKSLDPMILCEREVVP